MTAAESRRSRRAAKQVLASHRTVIDGAAISEAVAKNIDVVDLIAYHVAGALEAVVAQRGNILQHAVVTIGRTHPEYPGDLVIEAKTDVLLEVEDGKPADG